MKRLVQMVSVLGLFLLVQAAQAQWIPEQRLTWTSGYSIGPTIAVDSSRNLHVVWYDDTPGNWEIYYKQSTDEGSTWTTPQRLSWNSGDSRYPAIAVDSSGNLHVVWEDLTPGNWEIYYRQSTDGGSTWTTPRRLSWNSGDSRYPAIAVDSSGNLHVVWEDLTPGNWEIYYRQSTDGGSTWTTPRRLSWNSGDSRYPAIAVDSSGSLHVVWYDYTPGNWEIYYKQSTDGGSTWTTPRRLTWNSGDSWNPAIAVDPSGHLHVVWEDPTPGNWEIYYKQSKDGGSTWTTSQRLTWNSGSSSSPAIAVDSSGHLHVVWEDPTPGNSTIYYRQSADGGSTWTASQRLTWNFGSSFSPAIAVDSSDNLHVVWHEDTSGNYEIYYKKYFSRPGMTLSDIYWGDYRVGSGLQIPFRLSLGASNHGGVTVRIASADPNILRVAPDATTAGTDHIDIFIPDGQTYKDFTIQGVNGATGTHIGLSATNALFSNATTGVDIVPAVFMINNLETSTTSMSADDPFNVRTGFIHSNGTSFRYAPVSGAGPLTVTLTSSNVAVGQLKTSSETGSPVTVIMPVNTYDSPASVASGGVAFDPLTGGTTKISASAPGFNNAYSGGNVSVTVNLLGMTLSDIYWGDYRVGSGLQIPFRLTLGGSAHGGVTVRIASANPSILRVAPDATTAGTAFIDVYIPNGQTYKDFYIQGQAGNVGTAPLTATNSNFTTGSTSVEVVQGVLQILNLSTSLAASATDDPFQVRTGYLHSNGTSFRYAPVSGAGPLTVMLQSSNAAVGQLKTYMATGSSVTISIPINTYDSPSSVESGGVAFDPLTQGTTTISASASGFNNAYSGANLLVTVTP